MEFEFETKGLKELGDELKGFTEKVRLRSLNTATRFATKPAAEEAKRIAPERSGNVKSAIVLRKRTPRSKYRSTFVVTIKSKGAFGSTWYARLVEFGTVKQPAQPFMRVAFERHKEQFPIRFGNKLRLVIDAFNKKINKAIP